MFSGTLVSSLPQYGSMEPVGNWYSTSRTSPLPSPHLDKRFFDCSLIEMKSQASSSSTLDYDSMDEVWVKRNDVNFTPETVRRKQVPTYLPTYLFFTTALTKKKLTTNNNMAVVCRFVRKAK